MKKKLYLILAASLLAAGIAQAVLITTTDEPFVPLPTVQ